MDLKKAEVIKLSHLNKEQKKAYSLVHNKLTMNTGFDLNILSEELDSILDFDMSDFGFTTDISFEKEKEKENQNQRISENKELDIDEFSDEKFDLECPRCGFRWNDE